MVHKQIWCHACIEAKFTSHLANQRVLIANGVIRPEEMLNEENLRQKGACLMFIQLNLPNLILHSKTRRQAH
jgi:hypothetical protein